MGFKYVNGPTSDVTFEAVGTTLNELFENAAFAFLNVIYELSSLEESRKKSFEIEGEDEEDLLYLFLSELLILIEVENLFPKKFDLRFEEGKKLKAVVWGEDASSEKIENLVKGVTYHQFSLRQENGKWRCRVVLDI